jgi:hypothetical protein
VIGTVGAYRGAYSCTGAGVEYWCSTYVCYVLGAGGCELALAGDGSLRSGSGDDVTSPGLCWSAWGALGLAKAWRWPNIMWGGAGHTSANVHKWGKRLT